MYVPNVVIILNIF